MKVSALFITFLFLLNFSFAQEMKIKYDIIMIPNNPEMQAQIDLSEGSSFTIYTKNKQSRTEMNMGGLMMTTTIIDGGKEKGVRLLDGMLGKQAATFEQSEFDNFKDVNSDVDIEYTEETKDILGYTCKKAILYDVQNDIEMIFWYTEEIELSGAYLGDFSTYGFPGIALEYEVEDVEMSMKFTAVELKNKIEHPKVLFETIIPAGYTEKSFIEIVNLSGQ
jgi:GLPGLI family protein